MLIKKLVKLTVPAVMTQHREQKAAEMQSMITTENMRRSLPIGTVGRLVMV
jgi:hypothetical protein